MEGTIMCKSTESTEKYARKCDNCGKGMSDGYCIGDGESYACSDKCLFVDGYTPEQRDIDYENDIIYYTTWYDDDDIEDGYYTEDGEFIEGE
jgi:hypothetical protein